MEIIGYISIGIGVIDFLIGNFGNIVSSIFAYHFLIINYKKTKIIKKMKKKDGLLPVPRPFLI